MDTFPDDAETMVSKPVGILAHTGQGSDTKLYPKSLHSLPPHTHSEIKSKQESKPVSLKDVLDETEKNINFLTSLPWSTSF